MVCFGGGCFGLVWFVVDAVLVIVRLVVFFGCDVPVV